MLIFVIKIPHLHPQRNPKGERGKRSAVCEGVKPGPVFPTIWPVPFFYLKIQSKMKIQLIDYDHANLRRINGIQHAFEAWSGSDDAPTVHTIDAADFLEYCRETGQIHQDADISRHGAGTIRIPVQITGIFDAGRGEHYEAERMFSYSFADFLADFSGAGLTEALTNFINDSRTVAA